tara:strand:+ start:43 stop:189 length:147 start_codon:yes stop_codon:yes gene_type:complete
MGDKTRFKTPVPSANEEPTKKVITAVDSEGNLIYPKAKKGEYSTTGKP